MTTSTVHDVVWYHIIWFFSSVQSTTSIKQ